MFLDGDMYTLMGSRLSSKMTGDISDCRDPHSPREARGMRSAMCTAKERCCGTDQDDDCYRQPLIRRTAGRPCPAPELRGPCVAHVWEAPPTPIPATSISVMCGGPTRSACVRWCEKHVAPQQHRQGTLPHAPCNMRAHKLCELVVVPVGCMAANPLHMRMLPVGPALLTVPLAALTNSTLALQLAWQPCIARCLYASAWSLAPHAAGQRNAYALPAAPDSCRQLVCGESTCVSAVIADKQTQSISGTESKWQDPGAHQMNWCNQMVRKATIAGANQLHADSV